MQNLLALAASPTSAAQGLGRWSLWLCTIRSSSGKARLRGSEE